MGCGSWEVMDWGISLGKTGREQPSNGAFIREFIEKAGAGGTIKSGRAFYKIPEPWGAGRSRCLKARSYGGGVRASFYGKKRDFLEVLMALTGVPSVWAAGHPTKPSEGSSAGG